MGLEITRYQVREGFKGLETEVQYLRWWFFSDEEWLNIQIELLIRTGRLNRLLRGRRIPANGAAMASAVTAIRRRVRYDVVVRIIGSTNHTGQEAEGFHISYIAALSTAVAPEGHANPPRYLSGVLARVIPDDDELKSLMEGVMDTVHGYMTDRAAGHGSGTTQSERGTETESRGTSDRGTGSSRQPARRQQPRQESAGARGSGDRRRVGDLTVDDLRTLWPHITVHLSTPQLNHTGTNELTPRQVQFTFQYSSKAFDIHWLRFRVEIAIAVTVDINPGSTYSLNIVNASQLMLEMERKVGNVNVTTSTNVNNVVNALRSRVTTNSLQHLPSDLLRETSIQFKGVDFQPPDSTIYSLSLDREGCFFSATFPNIVDLSDVDLFNFEYQVGEYNIKVAPTNSLTFKMGFSPKFYRDLTKTVIVSMADLMGRHVVRSFFDAADALNIKKVIKKVLWEDFNNYMRETIGRALSRGAMRVGSIAAFTVFGTIGFVFLMWNIYESAIEEGRRRGRVYSYAIGYVTAVVSTFPREFTNYGWEFDRLLNDMQRLGYADAITAMQMVGARNVLNVLENRFGPIYRGGNPVSTKLKLGEFIARRSDELKLALSRDLSEQPQE